MDEKDIFHPILLDLFARAIVRCMLDERKMVAPQHTCAATRLDGEWDAIAERPEKRRWGGGGG